MHVGVSVDCREIFNLITQHKEVGKVVKIEQPDFRRPLVQIIREHEVIHTSWDMEHIPREGEKLALAKWDTLYRVDYVVHFYGKGKDVHCVHVHVKII